MSPQAVRHVRSGRGPGTLLEITPDSVGWRYLSFRVIALGPGENLTADTGDTEIAIVPLAGSGTFTFGGATHPVARRDVFTDKPHVLYLPPRTDYTIGATDTFEVAIGAAPAEGRHPARLYAPGELQTFVRGEANVGRGVTVTLDPSFASERLIAYEILTPSGNWSSFPPHRHDGRLGTSYHEETYYYRLTPSDGFAIQRLYTRDTDLDVSIAAADGDLVLVHEGYHTVATAPGTNAYYLNFLAGDTKPVVQVNDPAYNWIVDDWTGRPIEIPLGGD
ncbi:MAG: 5-deoxy-glucuronate isomerase [Chloroflexota bacterium]|jgi:5-deoxy-glucuronate isomerase|nr:5-deoxy-glucuronate isomerase [Chloroflexota bacterium]